jgi:hypothetical protein
MSTLFWARSVVKPVIRVTKQWHHYSTVEGNRQVPPITTRRAFTMAALNSFDPYVFPFVGVVAALGVDQGTTNYTKRYALGLAILRPERLHLHRVTEHAGGLWPVLGVLNSRGAARLCFLLLRFECRSAPARTGSVCA